MWYEKLKETLVTFRYDNAKADNSLYIMIKWGYTTYALVYVDDLILTGNSSEQIDTITKYLDTTFSIKDLGNLKYFLGIQVIRSSNSCLCLCQRKDIIEILVKAKMDKAKPFLTPMISNISL